MKSTPLPMDDVVYMPSTELPEDTQAGAVRGFGCYGVTHNRRRT